MLVKILTNVPNFFMVKFNMDSKTLVFCTDKMLFLKILWFLFMLVKTAVTICDKVCLIFVWSTIYKCTPVHSQIYTQIGWPLLPAFLYFHTSLGFVTTHDSCHSKGSHSMPITLSCGLASSNTSTWSSLGSRV